MGAVAEFARRRCARRSSLCPLAVAEVVGDPLLVRWSRIASSEGWRRQFATSEQGWFVLHRRIRIRVIHRLGK